MPTFTLTTATDGESQQTSSITRLPKDINRFHLLHTLAGSIAGWLNVSRLNWGIVMIAWEIAEMTILKGTKLADPAESHFDRILDLVVGFFGREAGVIVKQKLIQQGLLDNE